MGAYDDIAKGLNDAAGKTEGNHGGCITHTWTDGEVSHKVEIHLLTEEDGGGYIATVPDLPGCMADGETPEEALQDVNSAIVAYLQSKPRQ